MSPRQPAAIDVTAMVAAAGAETVDEAVDHLARRFLSVPLTEKDRALLASFLRDKLGSSTIRPSETLEPSLRELLYLLLSTPEYQVG